MSLPSYFRTNEYYIFKVNCPNIIENMVLDFEGDSARNGLVIDTEKAADED